MFVSVVVLRKVAFTEFKSETINSRTDYTYSLVCIVCKVVNLKPICLLLYLCLVNAYEYRLSVQSVFILGWLAHSFHYCALELGTYV